MAWMRQKPASVVDVISGTLEQPVPDRRIEIQGYKSIAETTLDLRPLNVLIGANGSGKSNLLEAFGLLSEIAEGRLQDAICKAGGASGLLHGGPGVTPKLTLRFAEGPLSYEAELALAEDDTLVFENEASSIPFRLGAGDALPVFPLGGGHRESKLSPASLLDRPSFIRQAWSWKVYHFRDTSPTAAVRRKGKLDDSTALRADGSNLAAFLYRLQETEPIAYRRILSAVQLAIPFLRDFALRPDPRESGSIQLEWLDHGSDAPRNASALSDGTLRFICLTTLLLQPERPSMILIDEPELGLHPYAVNVLAGMLRSASVTNCVLVATQSVTLINQLEIQDLVIVERLASGSAFRRVDQSEIAAWVDDYMVGELWEKNILGGRPRRP